MADMLVKLYTLPEITPLLARLKAEGIEVRQAAPSEKRIVAKSQIVIQVPEPFRPFSELVDLGAQGKPNVLFPTRRDVIRFLYLHELCHWWLYLTHGWGGSAEIACDRYAYANYRRRGVVRPPDVRRPGQRAA